MRRGNAAWAAILTACLGSVLVTPTVAVAAAPAPAPSTSVSTSERPPAPPATAPVLGSAPALGAAPSGKAAPGKPGPKPGPKRTKAADGACNGVLAFGAARVCDGLMPGQRHVFTVRTTVANDRLQTQFRSTGSDNSAHALLTGPAGTEDCSLWSQMVCEAPVPGVYTITVEPYSPGEGAAAYVLGIDSWSTPSACTRLDPASFSFTAPPREGSVPAASAGDCFDFTGAADDLLRMTLSGSGWMQGVLHNAAGEPLCQLDHPECRLSGDGPYRFFLYEGYGDEAAYTLRLTRMSRPAGCAPLPVSHFGDRAAAPVTGRVGPDGADCYTFAATSGQHLVQTRDGSSAYWRIRGDDGAELCSKNGSGSWCDLPAAGRYHYVVENLDTWGDHQYAASIVDLGSAEGCAAPIGTGWAAPPVEFTMSELAVVCQPFTASPGERVEVVTDYGYGWITDSTGARICDGQEEGDGCVLPGPGPYRVLAHFTGWGDPQVRIQVRSLSAPTGCPVVTTSAFGTAPAAPDGIRCRTLTVPAAGRYVLRAVDASNEGRYHRVFDDAGTRVCDGYGWCDLPAAGSYTMIADQDSGAFTTFFAPIGGPGCVPVSDQGATQGSHEGRFAGLGQTDCLQLPTAAGTTVTPLLPEDATGVSYPDLSVVDANGEYVCDLEYLSGQGCRLEGTAPFRAVVRARGGEVTGAYRLGFQRTDRMTSCAALPQGRMGSTTGATVSFAAGRYATCLAVPADAHAAQEIVSFTRTAGAGDARAVVFGDDGRYACGTSAGPSRFASCDLVAGRAYNVLVTADAVDATYRVNRRDSSPAGATCTPVTSTTFAGAPSTGSIAARDDVRCHRITGAAATDAFFLGVRSHDRALRYWVTDAAGRQMNCLSHYLPCHLSGSTAYQVFLYADPAGDPEPYALDTWRVNANGTLPAECPAEAGSTAYGFGPISGVLDGGRPGACLTLPVRPGDEYLVDLRNSEGGEAVPEPFMVSGGRIDNCSWSSAGGQSCDVSHNERSGKALFVLWSWELGRYPYRAEARCGYPLCGGNRFAVSTVSPASAVAGTTATITVTGTSLHARDVVELTAAGRPAVRATVRGVSADRTTLTAEVDLTGVAPGARTVAVTSFAGSDAELPGAFTVTAGGVVNTGPVTLTGLARVGATVSAGTGTWTPAPESYAYAWSADGVAIAGATAARYVVPAELLGKKLAVTVTARKAGLPDGRATSAAATVERGASPRAILPPSLTGTGRVNATMQVSAGSWLPTITSFTYEWRLNGTPVAGATGTSLKLTAAMAGKDLTVVVTAKRTGHADGTATTKAVRVTS